MNLFTLNKNKDEKKENTEEKIDQPTDMLAPSLNSESSINMSSVVFGEMAEVEKRPDTQDEPNNFFFDFGQVTMLNSCTIYFNCFVEKGTVDDAMRLIKRVNQNIASIELDYPELKGNVPFKFIINSGGGNVVQGLRLFDAIKNNVYPITTIANGMAASMGIIILVAGKKIQATEHSTLMIHQLSAGAQGKFNELQGHMKFWTDLQTKLAEILTNNTKAKKEDIDKFMQGETYILAKEALQMGLIQEIVNV